MRSVAIFPNSITDSYSLFYTSPEYPLENSMASTSVNVWNLPPLLEEKVALLRLVQSGDWVPDIGVRMDRHYIVYVPDDYEISGLQS